MKKTHIIGILVIAIAIGAIIIVSLDKSNIGTYAGFTEASNEPGSEFHVVGKRDKDKDMVYEPKVDANKFSFYMVDNKGVECKVVLHKNKPQDFEHSEQIVLIGKMKMPENEFQASDILMKCPSKYNDGKPQASN